MTDRDDLQLLREYTDHGSQPAFCELVRRYVDLVYTSAVRQVRDPHAAEDVTQTVFIILATKSQKLGPKSVLSAWLLGVTRFAARDHLKRTRRRRHYEHAAALERTAAMITAQNTLSTAAASGDLDTQSRQQLASVLDDALAKLTVIARDAMILRFFENQTFKQIGQRLGITELAARQRVFRALEQLRAILQRRGLLLGEESLSVALTATAVMPAPSSLAGAIASTAVSATSAAPYAHFVKGTVTLMKASSLKPAVLVTFLLLLLLGGVGFILIKWPKANPHPVAVDLSSAAQSTPGTGGHQPTRALIDITPPENFTAPSFGWVIPAPVRVPAFAVYAGPPLTGTVLSPDGVPLAGAQMLLFASANIPGAQAVPRRAVSVDFGVNSGADGRFTLRPRRQPAGILIKSPEGCAWIPADSFKPDQSITLARWARLEITVKQGRDPVSKARVDVHNVSLGDFEVALGNAPLLTDQNGRAVLEQVFPGQTRVSCSIDDSAKFSARQRRNERAKFPPREIRINVEPGKTQQVALGGTGRPITGTVDGDLREFDYRRGVLRSAQMSPIYFNVQAEGTFTVPDVPPGDYEIAVDLGSIWGKNIKIVETYATARTTFKMPPVPGDFSEEPLDIGKIPLTEKKVIQVNKPFPNLAGKTLGGQPISIRDFHGKILLIHIADEADPRSRGEIEWQHSVYSRFGHYPTFAMLTVMARQSNAPQATSADSPLPWPILRLDLDRLPEELQASSARMFLVDADGIVTAKNITAAQVYAVLDEALDAKPDPRMKFDYLNRDKARADSPFDNIPAPSADDAAAGARVSVIAGVPSWDTPKSDGNVLTDGKFPANEDAPAEALFFQAGTLEGRFRLDLKEPTNIAEIRTYSSHKDTRAAQVYRVFASDGSDKNFNPAPQVAQDPTKCGWTEIAFVDTRPQAKPVGPQDVAQGGRYVSSIADKQKGTLGTYRHLLFQVFVTEAEDVFGHTFYSEIDVIPAGPAAPDTTKPLP